MDYRPGQVDEVDHLLSAAPTTQRPDASCNHPDYNSFEKDEEAGHLSDELGKQITLIGAFKEAWAVSNGPGRLGLVIHALLVVTAVLGLLGLVLYIPVLIIMGIMG